MRLITFISAGTFIFLSAFNMKMTNSKQKNLLFETKWSLNRIHTENGIEDVQTKAFIKFDKEKQSAGGNGSCNNFGSDFILNKNKISFKNIFSTKMYCDGVQQIEDTFFKELEKINRYEVKDKTLFLFDGKDLRLEFESE